MSETIPKKKCYVTMTDKFMSGWGRAEGKINKFVIGSDNTDECRRIEKNAKDRKEMKYVNITFKKPSYSKKRVLISYKDSEELGDVWKK